MYNPDLHTAVDDGTHIPDYDDNFLLHRDWDDRFPYDLSDEEIHPENQFADNHAALEAETDIEPSAWR